MSIRNSILIGAFAILGIVIIVGSIVGLPILFNWLEIEFQSGESQVIAGLTTTIAAVLGLATTILILQHQLQKESREFSRELQHRKNIVARGYLPVLDSIGFSALDSIDAWCFGHANLPESPILKATANNFLILPPSVFDVRWPEFPDEWIALLDTDVAASLYNLKRSVKYFTAPDIYEKWTKRAHTNASSAFNASSGQFQTVLSAIDLGLVIKTRLGLDKTGQEHILAERKRAAEGLKLTLEIYKRINKDNLAANGDD